MHVPGGGDPLAALAATTDLGVVAHPDDLELLLAAPVLACRDDPARHFCGVVVTDGAGSVRPAAMADLDEDAFIAVRTAEQLAAADAARMGAVVLLGVSSDDVRSNGAPRRAVVDALAALTAACRPEVVHTHDPADAHRSHVAVVTASVSALRQMPTGERPARLIGWEGWRDLGWAPERRVVRGDLGGRVDDAVALARHHASQLGPKRYDAAVAGRWRANATFAAQREADGADALARGLDLTPLLDDAVDPTSFLADVVRAFADEVVAGVEGWW